MAPARWLPACLFAAFVIASAPARADEDFAISDDAEFGERGSIAFGGNLGLGGYQGLDHGYPTRVDMELDPALDVFLARRFSVGVAIVMQYTFERTSPSQSLVATSPRLGYAVPLGKLLALWPRVSLDLAYATDPVGVPHRIVSSTLFVPLDTFLLPHAAIGLGPALTQQLANRTSAGAVPVTTTVQLLVELAGWL